MLKVIVNHGVTLEETYYCRSVCVISNDAVELCSINGGRTNIQVDIQELVVITEE